METYGLDFTAIGPPWTRLTAYDLNKGSIKWQIGLGDDYRAAVKGAPGHRRRRVHEEFRRRHRAPACFRHRRRPQAPHLRQPTGKELRQIALGASSSGSPSMFELNGTPVSCCSPLRPSAPAGAEKATPPTRTSKALPA